MGRKIIQRLKKLIRKEENKAVKKCCHENQCGCKGQCVCEQGPFR